MTGGQKDAPSAGDMATHAFAALKAGNLQGALTQSEEGLRLYPDDPALLQALGLAAMQNGDAAASVAALSRCLKLQPNQPGLLEIYGGALESLDLHEEALSAYEKATALAPNRGSGFRMLGACLVHLQRFDNAKAALKKAIAKDENDSEAWFWLGSAEFSLSNLDAADAAFERAITLRPEWHKAWLNRATARAEQGRREEALEDYQQAINLGADDPTVFRQFAITLWDLHFIDEAEKMFLKSIALDESDPNTHANLSSMYEQSNRLTEAQKAMERALALNPDNLLAQKTRAVLTRRSGNNEEAFEQLTSVYNKAATRADRESAAFELAHVQDKRGETDAAFALFTEAKTLQSESAAGQRINPSDYLDQVEREADILSTTPPVTGTPDKPDTPPDPVFLLGFPRSGTTLLDQVLDSHPDAVVMDERPPLAEVHDRLTNLELNIGTPFVKLDEEQRQVARQFYFQRANTFVKDFAGKTLVDKHPLATAKVRIIKILFPRARIIFALRHPCDVVLSAFMQPFVVNRAMSNFHTLEGAVRTYEKVMSLWRNAEPSLDLPVHYIRYEDLVQNFEHEVTGVLKFCGLAWDERVAAFHEHARSRDVRTASSRQVTQPLYTSALARWKKYERYLEPHLDSLEPFINAFGYAPQAD